MSNIVNQTPPSDAYTSEGNGLSRSVVVSERPEVAPLAVDSPHAYQYEVEEETLNFRKLFALIHRRRKLMTCIFAAVMGFAIVMSILSPRVYQATAQVIINSQNSNSNNAFSALPAGVAQMLTGANGRSQETEIQILQSQPVTQAAIQRLPAALRSKPLMGLQVRTVGSTDIVNVSASSTDPNFARAFTNLICEAYVRQAQEESNKQYGASANYVKTQLETLKVQLDDASEDLMRYKERNGISDIASETAARVDRIKLLQQGLQQARVEQQAGQSQLQNLLASASSTPGSEIAPNVIAVRPVVQQYEQQLTSLQNQLSALKGEYQADAPEVRAIEDQIKRVRAQLAKEPRTQVQQYTRNVNPVRQSLDQQIVQLRAQNDANSSRIITFEKQLAEARQELASVPSRERNLQQLMMTLQGYQTAYQSLSEKYLQLRMGQAAPSANAKVLSPASDATQVRPKIMMNIITGLFAATLLSVLGAMLIDRLDNRIHSEDDVREATQMPVLALIPKVPHFETESLVAIAAQGMDSTHTPLLESYRMLRTSLMFSVLDSPSRCIMLTSSQPNEGKSSVAANLATVLAMNGKSVLLIDADLRRPSVHRLFGLGSEKGFSSVAVGLCSLEEAIQDTNVEGLRVLTVGPTPPNPPEMLDSRASRMLFKQARELADFVIIDAPPALMMADAQIVATEADGILLVVSWEEALKNAVAKTSDLLSRTGVKMLGVVVNKWDDKQTNYSRYYEHYALHSESNSK